MATKQQELISEFERRFGEFKKEYGFKATLEELDRAFYIRDAVSKDGFLSSNISRQVCYRIAESFMGWNDYLHSLIMPNPQNILNMSESKIFDSGEKNKIMNLMKIAMQMSSKNGLNGLTKNKENASELIDEGLELWNKKFRPELEKIMTKVNKEWKQK